MTPVVGDGRKDGRARKRKPTYWCEGCSKNFGSERNYSVHRARGRACNLVRSPAGGTSIMSTSTASLFAARHQDAHSEGVISGENEGDPQSRDIHNNRAMGGSSIPAGVGGNLDETVGDDMTDFELDTAKDVGDSAASDIGTGLSMTPPIDENASTHQYRDNEGAAEFDKDDSSSITSGVHDEQSDWDVFSMVDDECSSQCSSRNGSDADDRVSYSINSEHSSYSDALRDNGSDTGDLEEHSRRLGDLHRHLDGDVWDGGDRVKFNSKATPDCYPFPDTTTLSLFAFNVKWQHSRACLADLISMLRVRIDDAGNVVEEGGRRLFDADDVPTNLENFVARSRQYLPLLEVIKRKVKVKPGHEKRGKTFADCYDIPINLVLDRILRSPSRMEEMCANPGGHLLARESGSSGTGIGSDHVFPGPTREIGDLLGTNMNGALPRRSALLGYDGVVLRSGKKAYIGETVMVEFKGENTGSVRQIPCRLLALFWDMDCEWLEATVRMFRSVVEVGGNGDEKNHFGHHRVWEETGASAELEVEPNALLHFCEILTPDEIDAGAHNEPWIHGERVFDGWTFVGEGFVESRRSRSNRSGGSTDVRLQVLPGKPWGKRGSDEDNFVDMRRPGIFHNDAGMPYTSIPSACTSPPFECTGGPTRHLYPITIAESGASIEGEMAYSAGVVAALEKCCFGQALLRCEDGSLATKETFVRGALQLLVSDSPQRALVLHCKAANASTLKPCPDCWVTQTGPDGGDLGDPFCGKHLHRRKRAVVVRHFKELQQLPPGSSVASRRSTELGVNALSNDAPSPLYEIMTVGEPCRVATADILHVDGQGQQGLTLSFFFAEILNKKGRERAACVMADPSIYPPGARTLRNPVNHLSAYTASDKWLLGSIVLLVLRPIFANTTTMMSNLIPEKMKQLRKRLGATNDGVRRELLGFLQASSKMTFAIRAHVFDAREAACLTSYAEDLVDRARRVLGRPGVRLVVHMLLHLEQMLRDHGVLPNSAIGEAGHQRHKRSNKPGSGRFPPEHRMRRTNTLLALEGIVDGISWPARKWSRKRRMHVWQSVHAGPNCVAGLKALRSTWAGGLDGPTDPYEDITIGAKQKARGQTSGNAVWQATLWTAEDEAYHGGGLDAREEWADVLRRTHMRPDASLLIQALCLWYGCQQQEGVENKCGDSRCPNCWYGGRDLLVHRKINCSRIAWGMSAIQSSGLGRVRGGNARAAGEEGPEHAWALGEGAGEDVEIFKNPRALEDYNLNPRCTVDPQNLTMAKVLYTFVHECNPPSTDPNGGNVGEKTIWAACYEYKSAGRGKNRLPNSTTEHPTFTMSGKGRPSIFPVDAIRRHVHMWHACPDSTGSNIWQCGPCSSATGVRVWSHKYRNATGDGPDRFILNEHHHSLARDSFLDPPASTSA